MLFGAQKCAISAISMTSDQERAGRDVVLARYRRRKWQGIGTPPPGDSGHRPIPKEGDAVRAYLVNKGYNGAGYTTDGGYDVYYKNGFEILAPPTR